MLTLVLGCVRGSYSVAVSGQTRGSRDASLTSITTLTTGDKLHVNVRATRTVRVYLAFCNSSNVMEVYPSRGELVAPADVSVRIPTGDSEVEVDAHPGGYEVLFVITSIEPLERSDPSLLRALEQARHGKRVCGQELGGPPQPTALRGHAAPEPPPSALAGSSVPSPPAPASPSIPPPLPEPPRFKRRQSFDHGVGVRGMKITNPTSDTIVAHSDEAGIIIIAFGFEHR